LSQKALLANNLRGITLHVKNNKIDMSANEKEPIQEQDMTPNLNSDESMSEITHENDGVSTEDELSKLQAEVSEWKDKYMRLFAEFDNFKKRSRKENVELIQTAGKDVIISLLDVLDDSERAEKQLETAADIEAVKEGLKLVFNKLRNNLQHRGLKSFESKGEEFDVEKHEAVTEIPAEGMEGKVVDELQKGYLLNDKLIRHAKVVVGKSNDN
jgi:molecular chaperone GrpE